MLIICSASCLKRSVWSSWKKTAQLGSESEKVTPGGHHRGRTGDVKYWWKIALSARGKEFKKHRQGGVEVRAISSGTSGPTQTMLHETFWDDSSGQTSEVDGWWRRPSVQHHYMAYKTSQDLSTTRRHSVYDQILTTEKLEDDGCDI